jgi:hypothetical protein
LGGAAALTALTAVVNKATRGGDAADATIAAQMFTYNTSHDTVGEWVDIDEHKMTLTITTPFWLDNDEYILVELTIDQAGDTGVVNLLGAIANYTFRA